MTQPRPTNRFALWSLVATGLLLFPFGVVFAIIGLVQIARSKGQQAGALFAAIALFVSGIVAPGAALAALYGRPKAFDRCYYTQENAVGVLRLISYLEEQHKDKAGRYGSLEEIGFKPRVTTRPYHYTLDVVEEGHYLATARGSDYMDGDLIMVDESKQVRRVQDVCTQRP